MQIQIDVALILALISLLATGVSMVVFLYRIRFEVDALKRENAQQFEKLNHIQDQLSAMKEAGSLPTQQLERRIDELDAQLLSMSKTITDLTVDVKTMLQLTGLRSKERQQ